jgi:hypothetical protein
VNEPSISLPATLWKVLPPDTARTWVAIHDLVPERAYLGGGTAIAALLGHRVSRDLDFFLQAPIDLGALAEALRSRGRLAVQELDPAPGTQTLNAIFDDTKLQFLEASALTVIEPLHSIAGLQVAGLGDMLAMKLEVIIDRGELRDYFDLLVIEREGRRRVEEGIALALRKFQPQAAPAFVSSIVRGLGYLDNVLEDPSIPMPKRDIAAYWEARVPEIVRNLDPHGGSLT